MAQLTTIQIDRAVFSKIKKAKEYPRQTYNELLDKMTLTFLASKGRNQYDEFLHKIQQPKMQELWDNKEDEEWERV